MHRIEKRAELKSKVKERKISRTEANKQYIRWINEHQQDHIFRGELPFPEKSSSVTKYVLATMGQVMYLYSKD